MCIDLTVFQSRLQSLIDSSGKRKKDVAHGIDIAPLTLSRYTKMDRMPDLEIIIKLADYFNVSIDWLLGRSTEKYGYNKKELDGVMVLYNKASEDDRKVIDLILSKYSIDKDN